MRRSLRADSRLTYVLGGAGRWPSFLDGSLESAGAFLVAIANISPQEAGSNISAWAAFVGWETPKWLAIPSADTWGIWIGSILVCGAIVSVVWPVSAQWLSRLWRHPEPQEMTARQAVEWIARESKWAWDQNLLSSKDTAVSKAAVEFDQAARQGRISVLGCNSAGEYQVLNRGYWDMAHTDFLDISNPRGSDGQTLPMCKHRNILVNRQELMNTWPRAGRLCRLYVLLRRR